MIVTGLRFKGLGVRGKQNLLSIGNAIFSFDYRYNVNVSSGRVALWGDLGPKGLNLIQSNVLKRPYYMSDGIGDSSTTDTTVLQQLVSNPALNVLHNGTPYLQYAVARIGGSATINFRLGDTAYTANPGSLFQVLSTSLAFSHQTQNDVGSSLGNNNTAANSVPTGRFILLMRVYYGSGAGSNNAKMYIENGVTNFTYSPSFGTGNARQLFFGKTTQNAVDFKTKAMGAYDLSGKSIAQIDAFRSFFISILKSDPEYSSLTTP